MKFAVKGSSLYLFCDLSGDHGVSSTGKSTVVASSKGNTPIGTTGASLGLNLYCKVGETRDLDSSTLRSLQEPASVGQFITWKVEEGSTILSLMIDFQNVGDKVATSGKSVLLASTGGNLPVGKTGVMCGLNCYIPVGKKLLVENLHQLEETASLEPGRSVQVGNGFGVAWDSATEASITYTCSAEAAPVEVLSMPAFFVGDITLNLSLQVVAKKAKVDSPPTAETDTAAGKAFAPSPKSRNVLMSTSVSDKSGDVTIRLCFDPTKEFGVSGSGKSISVASTAGWSVTPFVGDGRNLRLNFNAYKAAPQLTDDRVGAAVREILDEKPKDALADISFKIVLQELAAKLGVSDEAVGGVKDKVKTAVKEYLVVPKDENEKKMNW